MLQKKALLQTVTIVTFKEIETDPIKVTTVTFSKSLEISTFMISDDGRHL